MRVEPVSKEVADAGGFGEPFKAGDYDFIIHMVEEGKSSAGNEMLTLTLQVFNRDGEKRIVKDWIVSVANAQWKARHMMESIGLARRYDEGIIEPREIEGKPGRCKLNVVPAKDQFPAKNAVADYLGVEQAEPVNTAPRARQPGPVRAGGNIDDDVIPF